MLKPVNLEDIKRYLPNKFVPKLRSSTRKKGSDILFLNAFYHIAAVGFNAQPKLECLWGFYIAKDRKSTRIMTLKKLFEVF